MHAWLPTLGTYARSLDVNERTVDAVVYAFCVVPRSHLVLNLETLLLHNEANGSLLGGKVTRQTKGRQGKG